MIASGRRAAVCCGCEEPLCSPSPKQADVDLPGSGTYCIFPKIARRGERKWRDVIYLEVDLPWLSLHEEVVPIL